MSLHDTAPISDSTNIPYEEQKQIIMNAIQQRFPAVKFREWPYHDVADLISTHKVGGCGIPHYQRFFTDLLVFLAKHGLTDAFCKEIEDPLGAIENLSRFFYMLGESPDLYQAFLDYHHLDITRVDKEDMTRFRFAMDYLYGADMDRIIKANEA